jgi:plasmid stability protein
MAQALIRNIDDELLERYRTRARAKGHSLEQELREALRRAEPVVQPPVEELKRLSAELRAMTPHGPPQDDSTLIIRRYRDTNGGRWTKDDGWADASGS